MKKPLEIWNSGTNSPRTRKGSYVHVCIFWNSSLEDIMVLLPFKPNPHVNSCFEFKMRQEWSVLLRLHVITTPTRRCGNPHNVILPNWQEKQNSVSWQVWLVSHDLDRNEKMPEVETPHQGPQHQPASRNVGRQWWKQLALALRGFQVCPTLWRWEITF